MRRSEDPPYAATFTPAAPTCADADADRRVLERLRRSPPAPSTAQPPRSPPTLPHAPPRRSGVAAARAPGGTPRTASSPSQPLRDADQHAAGLDARGGGDRSRGVAAGVPVFDRASFKLELFLWAAVVATLASWAIMMPGAVGRGPRRGSGAHAVHRSCCSAPSSASSPGASPQGLFLQLPASHDFEPRARRHLIGRDVRLAERRDLDAGYRAGRRRNCRCRCTRRTSHSCSSLLRWWQQAEWTRSVAREPVGDGVVRVRRLAGEPGVVVPAAAGHARRRR